MKKYPIVFSILVLSNQVEAYSGNELLEAVRAEERATQGRPNATDWQMSGFFSGFVLGVAFTANELSPKVCLPSTSTLGQYKAVVAHYLKENPAQLHRGAEQLVREALERSFPCK